MRKVKLLAVLILSMVWCTVSVWAKEENGWKPDDLFFLDHEEECILENREYYANGPNGKVVIYESPASSKVVKILKKGEIVLIDYIFTNEKQIAWESFEEFYKEKNFQIPLYFTNSAVMINKRIGGEPNVNMSSLFNGFENLYIKNN